MIKKSFFSIITCTLDSGKYLQKNIASVRSQKFTNYEHIFIDGYSTDATESTIKNYKKGDHRKVEIFFLKRRGISSAMNEGIKRANGDYLIFLHSDDYFYDNRVLETVHNFLTKKKFPDWVYGKIQVVDEGGKRFGTFPNWKILQNPNLFLLKMINFVPHQSVFIKKSILAKFRGFDTELSSSMDYDLWFRLANRTKWIFINRIISNFRVGKDTQSSGRKNKHINDINELKVARRYLNRGEYFLHRVVKLLLDAYNHTLR